MSFRPRIFGLRANFSGRFLTVESWTLSLILPACPVPIEYLRPGKFYHLTHRCHDRQFLFKFAQDRNRYRKMVWETLNDIPVEVFCYCLTSNHTHFLVRAEEPERISQWMQELEGQFAQGYNRRKKRSGSFWEDRYHCTMIEPGQHLWNCMVYIELNMVRAGMVRHPQQWPWCSYPEWMGQRQRYVLVNKQACLGALGNCDLKTFQKNYRHLIDETIAQDRCRRQPEWTESIAVGSQDFIGTIKEATVWRRRFETEPIGGDAWALKESAPALFHEPLEARNEAKNYV